MPPTFLTKFTCVLLEAEIAPIAADDFQNEYYANTGESAVGNPHYQIQDNKWGRELRVYFDAPDWVVESMRVLGYLVEERGGAGYRANYAYRCNSPNLWWNLVSGGYRLGERRL